MLKTLPASKAIARTADLELKAQSARDHQKSLRTKQLDLGEKLRRKWMFQRGKGHLIDFNDSQIRKLREYFNSLDTDGGGSISIDEIKVPLIGLGLVDTIKQVENIITMVDEDGSGEIEFNEFL